MKKILVILLLTMMVILAAAQQWKNNLPQDKVESGTLTFFDIQKAFNDYWEPFNVKNGYYYNQIGEKVKAPGWKRFRRWEWYWENRINPETGQFPETSALEEILKFEKENPGPKSTAGNWTSLGPTNTYGGYAGLGRINCAGFVAGDNNTIYVGSASGGIWKTTNGGSTWTSLGDHNAVLGVSGIIVVPGSSPQIIYIATGDRDGGSMWSLSGGQNNDNNSVGILKSTDGGTTWNTTGLSFTTSQQRTVNRILIDPADNSILYAATSVGLYKTINAGTDWTLLTSTAFIDMEFNPGTSAIIYGSTWSGDIYRSTNSGTSWTATLTTSYYRTELAVSANNSAIVYGVMADGNEGLAGVYKSTDNGASFTQIFSGTTINILNWDCSSTTSEGQGSYDLCISADPTNANNVFVGGVNTWKSTNGGTSWSLTNHWTSTWGCGVSEVHADQHFLGYQNGTSVLFEGNDGGFYKTTDDGSNWTHLGSGLATSQVYRMSTAQTVSNEDICGLQDNGTKAFLSGSWTDEIGGDGFDCAIDYSDNNVLYGELYYGDIQRSTNHGASWTSITSGLSGTGYWIAPILIDPSVHTTIYIGYQDVFKSTNQGTTWTKISTWAGSTLRSLAVAPSNSQYIYAATQSILYRTINGGTAWSNITGTIPVGSGYITSICVKNNDPNTAWVSLGGYNAYRVYETTNGGTTWTNISSGLPSIPVMSLIQNKQNSAQTELYAGTDAGVYVKVGSSNWMQFSTGLPNVVVTDLDIYYNANPLNSKLRAGTYGRGLWQSDLYSDGPPVADFSVSTTTPNTGEIVIFSDLSNNTPTSWIWTFEPASITYVGGTSSTSQNPQVQFSAKGPYSISLTATNTFGSDSETKTNYILVGTPGLWTGTTSELWTSIGNWDNLSVPTSSQNITIPGSAANWPVYSGDFIIGSTYANLTLQGIAEMTVTGNLTINNGFRLTFTGNGLLKTGGNWTNNGTFESGTGTVEFMGSNPSIINSPPGSPVYLINDNISTWQGNWNGNLGTGQGNFNQVSSANAGGISPEARFYWINSNTTKRMYYDPVNTSGHSSLTLSFRHMVDHWASGYTVKVEYSTDASTWYDAGWSITPSADVGSTQVDLTLTGAQGIGSSTYYVSFTITGNLYNIDYWYIDDVQLHFPGSASEEFYNLTIAKNGSITSTNGDIDIDNNLIIMPDAWLTNETGNTLNISGGINIKADLSGLGSFLDKGTTNVSGISNVEQYLTSERWHLVSSPVSNATINTYFDIYLKYYNEPSNSWTSLVEPLTIPLNVGQGYAAWADDLYTGSSKVVFSGGTLRSSDLIINSLDYTSSSPKAGYNLIGNPFPCALDWNADWTTSNLSGWVEIYENGIYRGWHPTLGGYNGMTDGIIPSTQGFWVRALNSSASLTIPSSERTHNSQDYYKSEPENNFPVIRLEAIAGDLSDETVIMFHPDGTDGFDGYYDLEKLYNSDESPQLYTFNEQSIFSFNVMAQNFNEKIIPVGFENIHEGVYQIQVKELNGFNAELHFYLQDLITSEYYALIEGGAIWFAHSPLNNQHRFNLRITKSGLGYEDYSASGAEIFSYGEYVIVNTPESVNPVEISVYDLLGQLILLQPEVKEQESRIRIDMPGQYLVKVKGMNLLVTKQVFIR
jgi:PKD repeat protein